MEETEISKSEDVKTVRISCIIANMDELMQRAKNGEDQNALLEEIDLNVIIEDL